MGFTSFVLGLYALSASLGYGISNYDDMVACGDLPPGYSKAGFNRCTKMIALQEGWVSTLLLAILATTTAVFLATILTSILRGIRSRKDNSKDRLVNMSRPSQSPARAF